MVEKKTKAKTSKPKAAKSKSKTTKAKTKKSTTKSKTKSKSTKLKAKSSKKPKNEPIGDAGIVIVEDDLTIDQEKVNEERKAYLEEARSQEAFD